MLKVTTHTIVKNEENWVKFVLEAWEDFASEMLVTDDNSTDGTAQMVKSLNSPKIKFSQKNLKTATDHTDERNRMLKVTKTDWFVLLDGDEVWNKTTISSFLDFLQTLDAKVLAVVMRTRNCIGDVYHYLPESAGKYELLSRKGHLNVRAYRKVPGYSWQGEYPLEFYGDGSGKAVNEQPDRLAFYEGYYWHLTHLPRSSAKEKVKGWRKVRLESGIKVSNMNELPEVLRDTVQPHRSILFEIAAALVTPLKEIRRRIEK